MMDTLEGHQGKVKALALSPDGRFAVTAGADRTARVWDLTTAQQLRVFREHTTELQAAAFSRTVSRLRPRATAAKPWCGTPPPRS